MNTRTPLIAGNWKMNKLTGAASAFAREFKTLVAGLMGVDVLICPPFTCLAALREEFRDTPVGLGGQNMFYEPDGAYTGEVSAEMLLDAGCAAVILGHSERREIIGETDEIVRRKTRLALQTGLRPIVCVGETLAVREAGRAAVHVRDQTESALAGLSGEEVRRVTVAYEPIWAIGTGRTATAADAQEICSLIRATIASLAGGGAAAEVRVLYGGSVKAANIAELLQAGDIDGALVGGASLQAAEFAELVRLARVRT
ncbi:MAG: triose-phosphate isomerase [Gracilibacteraceae bacterium]|jgi:triosephosphate isomerase|nr:triose-phosphate isomerase [Gracilibacteraceae bacterium]